MTDEQFDFYSFSIWTEIKTNETSWLRIESVDFGKRIIGTRDYGYIPHNKINDIRN